MLQLCGLKKKRVNKVKLVAGEGFEPSKAEPGDLQSPPIGRSGNPPGSFFYGGRKITSNV
jgi:hypothetical protein